MFAHHTSRYMLTPIIVPIAYPTTPQTIAEIVPPCSLPGSLFFMRPQNTAAIAGPLIAALEAIPTSSRSNEMTYMEKKCDFFLLSNYYHTSIFVIRLFHSFRGLFVLLCQESRLRVWVFTLISMRSDTES